MRVTQGWYRLRNPGTSVAQNMMELWGKRLQASTEYVHEVGTKMLKYSPRTCQA